MENNIEIIPTNFALDKKTFEEKLEKLKFAKTIHIDFMDRTFTPKKSIPINQMNKINQMNNTFEIHLMTKTPEKYLEEITKTNITKVLIHIENYINNIEKLKKTINEFKKNNLKIFIVFNPETNINIIKKIPEEIDGVMLMSVIPGAEGQKFIEKTYNRIKKIKEINKNIPIQIDGGINDKNIKKIIESGANILSIGSFISSSKNSELIYENILKKI